MVDCTLLPGEIERIDFSTWDFVGSYDEKANKAIQGLCQEAMRSTFEDATVQAEFYWQWNTLKDEQMTHARASHPLDIYIELPLDNGDWTAATKPAVKVSLHDLVADMMDQWGSVTDPEPDGRMRLSAGSRPHMEAFVKALEDEARWARELLSNAVEVDDDGREIEQCIK